MDLASGLVPLSEVEGLARFARGIPLHARDGSIRAFAMVDAEDYARLAHHRWFLMHPGYAVRFEGGPPPRRRTVRLHRAVLDVADTGDPRRRGAVQVDHINRDKLDCRKANLRVATRAQNAQNLAPRTGCTSKHRGVTWHKAAQKWMAQGQVGRRRFYLGLHSDELEAARVAREWRLANMPFAKD